MIITQLMGGLGNQMFQYAAARSLSIDLKTILKLDVVTYFSNPPQIDTPRHYSLNCFNINENLATSKEIESFLGKYKIYLRMKYRLNKYFQINYFQNIYMESSYSYDSNIERLSSDVYLFGFWQSEKYFLKNKEQIKRDFTIKEPFSKNYISWLKKIDGVNSVAVHIRRGDMANNKLVQSYHGICSLNYYQKAIQLMKENNKEKIVLFIFSDDIKWVKDSLKTNSETYFVSQKSNLKDYEEMMLMSRCKHNIIANSSFSWWSAWLNNNSQKIVIVPEHFFANPKVDTKDLIPKTWIKV